jgi:hypothetical protein
VRRLRPGEPYSRGAIEGDDVAAGTDDARRASGAEVVPRATPVPAPPPGVTDVLRRSARLGLGAIGLAGRAAGSVFARVPDTGGDGPESEPGLAALLPGAVLGIAIEAEKRAAAVVDSVAARTGGVARVVGRPAVVQRALRPLEDRLWHWNEVARREQHRNQAQAAALIPVIVQQVTENVIAQLDFVRIVEQLPIDDIAAAIDVEAIVQRIDLGGVIRESTASLTMETVDAFRSEGITLDAWLARTVDKVLFRSRTRELDVGDGS